MVPKVEITRLKVLLKSNFVYVNYWSSVTKITLITLRLQLCGAQEVTCDANMTNLNAVLVAVSRHYYTLSQFAQLTTMINSILTFVTKGVAL